MGSIKEIIEEKSLTEIEQSCCIRETLLTCKRMKEVCDGRKVKGISIFAMLYDVNPYAKPHIKYKILY